MPATTIDRNLIIQFSDMMHVKAQQLRARLRPFVKVKPMSGDIFAYDGLGQVEAREVTGRVQPTVFDDIEHLRRKISRRRFVVTLPIDDMDVRGLLTDPEGEYAAAVTRAMERVFDKVGIQAMFATVYTGRDFETSVTFATDGGQTVTATAGLTYEKLLEINQNWVNYEVGNDVPIRKTFGITGTEETALMKETELISGDFVRSFSVENGEMTRAAGLQLLKYGASVANPLLAVAAGVRSCFALAENGLCYGLSKEFKISIQDRPDYVDTKQVQIIGILGAVRTEGILIQQVTTTV
jgi:hypothetical protein